MTHSTTNLLSSYAGYTRRQIVVKVSAYSRGLSQVTNLARSLGHLFANALQTSPVPIWPGTTLCRVQTGWRALHQLPLACKNENIPIKTVKCIDTPIPLCYNSVDFSGRGTIVNTSRLRNQIVDQYSSKVLLSGDSVYSSGCDYYFGYFYGYFFTSCIGRWATPGRSSRE